jgi:hypothetical protein
MVLGALLTEFTTEKVPLFVAKLSRGRHDSTNFAEKVIVPKIWAYQNLSDQIPPFWEA